MNVLDVCSGIGGFSLAAAWCGWQTVGFCEIDPYCQRVLAKHWPGVPQHDNLWTLTPDIVSGWLAGAERARATRRAAGILADAAGMRDGGQGQGDGDAWLGFAGGHRGHDERRADGRLDLLAGGIPCQPFSVAGKQRGQDDPRHLWPAVARLVADLRPRWCLFENVSGFIRLALDDLLADLDRLGYAAWALVVPAAGVGALHRRDRVWIVAHAEHAEWRPDMATGYGDTDLLSLSTERPEETDSPTPSRRRAGTVGVGAFGAGESGQIEPRFRPETDGLSDRLARFVDPAWNGDPMQAFGRNLEYAVPLVTAERVPERVNKLKALGNSIVPQIAYQIFCAMQAAEEGRA